MSSRVTKWTRASLIICSLAELLLAGCTADEKPRGVLSQIDTATQLLEGKLTSLCWVAYAPTNFNPDLGLLPDNASVSADLHALRQEGFEGIITYGGDIVEDITTLPPIADSLGFKGIILGIWDPTSDAEVAKVVQAGRSDLVLGFCVGNESLNRRYDLQTLSETIEAVRAETSKPATTTEELEDYQSAELLNLGDWLFVNAHPYWNGVTQPDSAVMWTVQKYDDLECKTKKLLVFKEVGLPTSGDPRVNEQNQAAYYRMLKDTDVQFVYFEAFDQPWKTHAPVEPYWGLFRSDRSPKEVVSEGCCDSL